MQQYGVQGIKDVYKISTTGIITSLFFSSLFVLIEGWQLIQKRAKSRDIQPLNEEIESLLRNEDNVMILKRFRNYMYHFQNSDQGEIKWNKFILGNNTILWANTVYEAFRKIYISDVAEANFGGEIEINEKELFELLGKSREPATK